MANNNKTNYKQMYAKGKRKDMSPIDEAIPEEVKEEVAKSIKLSTFTSGKVACSLLNVRVAPYTDADIVAKIRENSEVSINLKSSTEDWYSVTTKDNVPGFCMKKFIAVC